MCVEGGDGTINRAPTGVAVLTVGLVLARLDRGRASGCESRRLWKSQNPKDPLGQMWKWCSSGVTFAWAKRSEYVRSRGTQ
jgi:hypothetical protein